MNREDQQLAKKTRMGRISISFPRPHLSEIKKIAEREGLAAADIVRKAIAEFLDNHGEAKAKNRLF